ncbi:hypothetical protein ACSQ67_001461 [Phaseolus vulgaris]
MIGIGKKPWSLLLQQGRRRSAPQPGHAYRTPRSPGLQSRPRCAQQVKPSTPITVFLALFVIRYLTAIIIVISLQRTATTLRPNRNPRDRSARSLPPRDRSARSPPPCDLTATTARPPCSIATTAALIRRRRTTSAHSTEEAK